MEVKIAALLGTSVAAVMDIRTGKVPNRWILPAALGGAAAKLLTGGGLCAAAFLWAAVPALLLLPLFRFRMLGAADIKLLCALGLLLERRILACMAWSFAFGGILSAVVLLRNRGLWRERIAWLSAYIGSMRNTGKASGVVPYRRGGLERPENIPFTAAILGSVLLYCGGVY